MSDILEKLRNYSPPDRTMDDLRQASTDIHEAADEISRLRALCERYRPIVEAFGNILPPNGELYFKWCAEARATLAVPGEAGGES